MLERVEALLLHPFLASVPDLANWKHVSKMLSTGRQPGICSFAELCSDAETLLAISLREDPGRTGAISFENTILNPQRSVLEAAEAAAQHSQEARSEAAARICANHAAIVAFACCGRGCGRSREEARKAAEAEASARESPDVDFALRQVAACLLRRSFASELESDARRAARAARDGSGSGSVAAALRFLSQNVGVPRDMAAAPAAALRAQLVLHVAALESRGPAKSIARPAASRSPQPSLRRTNMGVPGAQTKRSRNLASSAGSDGPKSSFGRQRLKKGCSSFGVFRA